MPFWTRKTWVGTETDELTSMAGAQLSSLGADLANSRIALRLYDPPQLWRVTADRVLGPTLARQRILLDAMGWRGRDGTIAAGSNRRSAPCHSRMT